MPEEHTRYSRLANITKLINTKLELREVLEHVVTAISEEIVQCDSVGIYLPQEDGSFRGYAGKPKSINGMSLDTHIIDMEMDQLAKEVVETQKAIYISDTSKDNRPDPRAVEGFQIKSLLVLPISYEQELFGLVFLFDYGIPMNLTESEIQTVEAYVNMVAVAIQNSANLVRKENLIKDKQLLLDVTRDLSMCSSMQESLDTCFFYLGKVLNNYNTGVHLLDPIAEQKIKPAKLSKNSDWSEEDWIDVHNNVGIDQNSDPLFQEVIKTKKPLLISDVFKDPRPNHIACRLFGIKGMFLLPLVSMGKVLGLIAIAEFEKKELLYSEANIQLAQSIVDATASTLSHLLYMEKQELIIKERTSEITEKKEELEKAITKLQRLSREKELILNSAGEGIFGLDLDGRITFCNPAGEMMLGYEEYELINKPAAVIFQGDKMDQSAGEEVSGGLKPDSCSTDKKFFRKDNTSFSVEYVISSIQESGKVVGDVVTFKDISARKKMEEKIKYHAYYDSLTGLPNRVLSKERLVQGLECSEKNKQKLAVLYMDLDRFKLINDTLGHSYGDLLLRDVADRLCDCIPGDVTISRQGGDEFTIILPGIENKQEVVETVKKVNASFAKPFDLEGQEINVRSSIGISVFPEDGITADILIKNADTAMYKSKELSGDNYHFYTPGMDTRTLKSIELENALYKALDRDELVIYYQPQINYKMNKLIGVEALLRWNHPTEGMILPDRFIPIAEETGLIIPIGEWVMENACRQVKEWHLQGYPLISVSVNLSVRQFEQNDLFSNVKNVLEKVSLPPEFLHLELTENHIIKNTEAAFRTMEQLKELGVNIDIDDFGTGYSSLGYLKSFPISTLKIDKSFIQDIIEDSNNVAITNTIINLAQNMLLNVIAEGVETKEQAEFLSARNCFLMQGYFFSRPISSEDFAESYFNKMK